MEIDQAVNYEVDCSKVGTEQLVNMRDNIQKLISSQENQLWAINKELLIRVEANGGPLYGSDHILEAKEGRATFSHYGDMPPMQWEGPGRHR